jgi:predicted transcriptional regulator
MRRSAEWMTIADERILEFLEEEGPHLPSKMEEDDRLYFSDQYIGRRCRTLAEYGLVQNLGNGVYSITEEGRQYLSGDLDVKRI